MSKPVIRYPRVNASYHGFEATSTGERRVLVKCLGSRNRLLPKRLNVRNHSPMGFEWGYSGSGPAQLALAMMIDFLGDEKKALSIYQAFKEEIIAGIPQEVKIWEITGQQILDSECYKLTLVSEVMES